MFPGRVAERGWRAVDPRETLVDLAVGMAVDDLADDIAEVGVRVDVIALARFDQRGDGGQTLAAAIGSCEQGILAIEDNGADGAFYFVGVDFDASIVDEAGQALPA